jgi:hypothetical protein
MLLGGCPMMLKDLFGDLTLLAFVTTFDEPFKKEFLVSDKSSGGGLFWDIKFIGDVLLSLLKNFKHQLISFTTSGNLQKVIQMIFHFLVIGIEDTTQVLIDLHLESLQNDNHSSTTTSTGLNSRKLFLLWCIVLCSCWLVRILQDHDLYR